MKRILFLVVILNFSLVAYSQVIKGTIYDSETKKPVYSAAVYFNGTSAGTLTDANGNFKLDILNFQSMPLSVSAIGYYSATIQSFSSARPVQVYLKPRVFELSEVTVNEKSHARQRKENLVTFREVFLGTTGNSLNCEIKNEDDIRFKLNGRDTLTAFVVKPLIIDNKSLGYKITYYLEEFQFNRPDSTFLFSGQIIFKDKIDSTVAERKKAYYDKKRGLSYYGSRMHFFRSLWFNDLDSAGFRIFNSEYDLLGYRVLVSQSETHEKYLKYSEKLSIAYDSERPTSLLIFLKDSVLFDPNGYFEPHGITWEGELSRQRIADMLPYDYSIIE